MIEEFKTRTGAIFCDTQANLEYLYVGDYGQSANIKANFLGLTEEINRVEYHPVDFKLNAASFAIELEAAVELPSPMDDIWETLYDERKMDIIIKDDRGHELHIPNAQIIQRIRITGRIPRKMKKHLKRIHGVDWKQYHPNAENEVNISGK